MSTAIILYDILQEQGIEKARAKKAVSAFITREEVQVTLATKDDLRKLTMWITGMLIGQVAIISGVVTLLIEAATQNCLPQDLEMCSSTCRLMK